MIRHSCDITRIDEGMIKAQFTPYIGAHLFPRQTAPSPTATLNMTLPLPQNPMIFGHIVQVQIEVRLFRG